MKKSYLAIILIALHGMVVGQENVSVTLTDASSSTSIPYADIYNQSSGFITSSNENGVFHIKGALSDTVKISSLGYLSEVFSIQELKTTHTIRLVSSNEYLKEITILASKRQNIGVQHIDKLSLKLQPINNAQDLLKTVSGLFIAQHAGGGKAEQIFFRGFDNDHGTDFAVFIDDIPVNLSSHAHGQGYADMHFMIPEVIQDADYYKGPYELKNGNFSVSGAARFKTKNELDGNTVKLEVGQYGYKRGVLLLDLTPENKLFSTDKYESAYIALTGTLNDSYFDASQKFKKVSGLFKYNVELGNQTSLTFMSSYFTSSWDASGQIPLRAYQDGSIPWFGAVDNTEGGETARLNTSIKITSVLKNDQKITNQLYFSNNKYTLFSNFTFFLNDPVNGDMIAQKESRNILGYTFEYDRKDVINTTKLTSTFAAGFRSDWINSSLWSSISKDPQELKDKNKLSETNYWAYAKGNWQLTPSLVLQFGSRLDYFTFDVEDKLGNNVTGSKNAFRLSPKVSLFYNPIQNIQLFVKGGSGFHSNYTQAAVKDRDIHPLPKALAVDLGTEFRIGDKVIGSVAAWALKSNSEYIFVADAGEYENNGASFRKGIDVSVKINPMKNLWINSSANWSKGILLDVPNTENSIPSAPRFTNTSSVIYTLEKQKMEFYLGSRYMAKRPLTEDESVTGKDYFLLDASITKSFNDFKVAVSAQNLLNIKWKEAVFYDASRLKNEVLAVDDIHFTPGTPRYVKVALSYNF
ncbi:MAG: TonB-dependent receptor [Flavobacteriaceae bacterium]|nr:MAG: TonB-dependent receptor [Flavobacteriaceae bacterium]